MNGMMAERKETRTKCISREMSKVICIWTGPNEFPFNCVVSLAIRRIAVGSVTCSHCLAFHQALFCGWPPWVDARGGKSPITQSEKRRREKERFDGGPGGKSENTCPCPRYGTINISVLFTAPHRLTRLN